MPETRRGRWAAIAASAVTVGAVAVPAAGEGCIPDIMNSCTTQSPLDIEVGVTLDAVRNPFINVEDISPASAVSPGACPAPEGQQPNGDVVTYYCDPAHPDAEPVPDFYQPATQPLFRTSGILPGAAAAVEQARLITADPPDNPAFQAACPGRTSDGGEFHPGCSSWCLHLTAGAWQHRSEGADIDSGHYSARTMIDATSAAGRLHADRTPPIGAILLYYSASGDGHAVVYIGSNTVLTSDFLNAETGRQGGAYLASATQMEHSGWAGLSYAGWATPEDYMWKDITVSEVSADELAMM